jgi:UDP-galactopyranose mutase
VALLVLMKEYRKHYFTEIMSSISKSGFTRSCKNVTLRVKSRLVLDHSFSDCLRCATTATPTVFYWYAALIKNKKDKNLKNE